MSSSTQAPASGPPMAYEVHAATVGGGRAQVEAGSETVTFDASWEQPPTGLPGPAELLAAAFAACLLKNVARTAALLPFDYGHAEVDVIARRQDAPPTFVAITYQLRLVTDEPARRVELLHTNLRRFGTVYNTLAAVCEVDGSIVAVEIGLLTPPFGISVFVIKSALDDPDIPLGEIFRGAAPFALMMLVLLALVMIFPSLATILVH